MRRILLRAAAVCLAIGAAATIAAAGPVDPVPPLPPPSGDIVRVSTEAELQSAIAALRSNTAIVLAPGTYNLTSTLWIKGPLSHIEIRGGSAVRDAVVLAGRGMSNRDYGGVPHGIWAGGGVSGLTIANLTIRDVYQHAIILNAGVQGPLIYNVHLVDAGEQFIKSNPDGGGGGVNGGRVEHSVIEYGTIARGDYTNGIDVHTGRGWTIKDNLIRNIRAPATRLAGPAVLMWNGSRDSVVEGNTFVNCQREIALGLIERTPDDHAGGIVRNNFIYRDRNMRGDTAIGVSDSPGTLVLHNSILLSGTYPSPIEYRFAATAGVTIAGNLLDGRILARDGAAGTAAGNDTTATGARFVNAAAGDLHLRAGAPVERVARHAQALTDWDGEPRPGALADAGADQAAAPRAPVTSHPGAPR